MKLCKAIAHIVAGSILATCLTAAVSFAAESEIIGSSGNLAAAAGATPVSATAPGTTQDITPTTTPSPTPEADIATDTAGTPIATPTATPDLTPSSSPAASPSPTPVVTPTPKPVDEESLWYREKLPLKKEHQKLLWDYCKTRKLDYIDMLALISTESNFNEKSSHGRYKGYFQISTSNAANLSKTLKTQNKPLDGAININWGTAMYSWILADKRVKGIEDEKKKRDIALSIYSRGTGGYDKYGLNTSFLKRYYKMRSNICAYFEDKPVKK